jgi:hypothetical protein
MQQQQPDRFKLKFNSTVHQTPATNAIMFPYSFVLAVASASAISALISSYQPCFTPLATVAATSFAAVMI